MVDIAIGVMATVRKNYVLVAVGAEGKNFSRELSGCVSRWSGSLV